MNLIVKPTSECNFKCAFCSSTQIGNGTIVPSSKVTRFLERFPGTQHIIINGGDPLMMPPSYYEDIISFIDKNNLSTHISLTSNLYLFKLNPEKWKHIVQNKHIGITTSFQYGNKRIKHDGNPLTEEEFIETIEVLKKYTGYYPDFISVIDEDNFHFAIDHVRLAKRLGIVCKMNPAIRSGRQSSSFPYHLMFDLYLDIIENGLEMHEYNCMSIIKIAIGLSATCPYSRECGDWIRVLQPNGYFSCGSFADGNLFPIDFDAEIKSNIKFTPKIFKCGNLLKTECATCPLFKVCNGCIRNIEEIKTNNLIENHCTEMKKNLTRFLQIKHNEKKYEHLLEKDESQTTCF